MIDPGWVREADAGHFWLFAGLTWSACVAGFAGTWHFSRRLRLVEDTPESLIRSAAQGYVELQGHARLMPGDPIIAPLTRQSCAWWRYTIERYSRSGRSSHWTTVERGTSDGLFLIDDGSGQCVVDPDGAVVYASSKDVWYGDTPMPEGGPGLGKFAIGSSYRYTEERMHDGDFLYALGQFHTQGPASGADIDEEVRRQLAAWKRDQAELLRRFDVNHDGQVDIQEWDAARAEARRIVLEQERQSLQRPPVNILGRDPDGRDFVLSTLPQNSLEWRLRLYAAGCLAAFLLAGAFGTWLLNARG